MRPERGTTAPATACWCSCSGCCQQLRAQLHDPLQFQKSRAFPAALMATCTMSYTRVYACQACEGPQYSKAARDEPTMVLRRCSYILHADARPMESGHLVYPASEQSC